MERWKGRVALVTGACGGIGSAIAKTLVQHGIKVVGCSNDAIKLQELAEELKDQSGSLTAINCDVTKEDEILAMFQKIKSDPALRGVDICINGAGVGHMAPLLTGETSAWRNMIDVNVLGLCICTREAYRSMKDRGVEDGQIILIDSTAGHRIPPEPEYHFYSATKFAVTAILQGIRNELRELHSHIRVAEISPGDVETGFFVQMWGEERAKQILGSAKNLEAQDIADAVVFILQTPPHVEVNDIILRSTEQLT